MTITVSDIIAITALLISLILSYFQFFRNKCIVKANIYSLSSLPIKNYILPIKLDIVFVNLGNQKGIISEIYLVIKHSQPYGALTNTIKSRLLVMVNGNRRAYIPPSENICFDIYPHNVIRKEYTFSIDTQYLLDKFDPVNGIESFFDELRKEIEMEIEITSIDHKANFHSTIIYVSKLSGISYVPDSAQIDCLNFSFSSKRKLFTLIPGNVKSNIIEI